jgi:hypothetical protein
MWNFADDYGIISASPRKLLGEAFENDESVTLENVVSWIAEIEALGFIRRFTAEEKEWLEIAKFNDHQQVKYKSTRTNPKPPAEVLKDLPKIGPKLEESLETFSQSWDSNALVNDNDNANVLANENGSGEQKPPPPTETAEILTPEYQLFAHGCAFFSEDPKQLGLTPGRKRRMHQIRYDRNVGSDKFLAACENRARDPAAFGDISVLFFIDDDFKWAEKITKWSNGVKHGTGADKRHIAKDADKGDDTGWDHLITVCGPDGVKEPAHRRK